MGTQIATVSKAVTAATVSGVCTVDSTTPIWPSQIGWLSKSGQVSVRIQVVEIISATTFRARVIAGVDEGHFARSRPNAAGANSPAAYPTNAFSDLVAFHLSATFDAEAQVVQTNNDNGKMPSA